MLQCIRRLRHGPLKFLGPVWLVLGNAYRAVVSKSGLSTSQQIGPYGPFKLDAKFAFSNFANWGGGHNDGFAHCVEACRGKSCVLDIGAHIGLVSLPVASVLAKGGKLVSFEPAGANRALLERHARLNGFAGTITVEGALVGDEDGVSVPFFEMADATGMNTIVPGAMDDDYRPNAKLQVSVDAYCARTGLSPEIIKIDVEGAELRVLRGAREILKRCRPLIFLSVHPRQIALLGETVEDLSSLIDQLGYDCRNTDGTAVSKFGLREYTLIPRKE